MIQNNTTQMWQILESESWFNQKKNLENRIMKMHCVCCNFVSNEKRRPTQHTIGILVVQWKNHSTYRRGDYEIKTHSTNSYI